VAEARIGRGRTGGTGRMGTNQHLVRSVLAIGEQGGVRGPRGTIVPEPVLVGRDADKLARLAKAHDLTRYTTDLDEALAEPDVSVYLDALATSLRAPALKRAVAAGKHVYCEKPIAAVLYTALDLARAAEAAGCKNRVVQDQ